MVFRDKIQKIRRLFFKRWVELNAAEFLINVRYAALKGVVFLVAEKSTVCGVLHLINNFAALVVIQNIDCLAARRLLHSLMIVCVKQIERRVEAFNVFTISAMLYPCFSVKKMIEYVYMISWSDNV